MRKRQSRRRLAPGTKCYLCGHEIVNADWNRDHVPPARTFGTGIKKRFNPNLEWLYTHRACNAAYREDEEYFFAALPIQASGSAAAEAVLDDFRRGLLKGHGLGLYETIKRGFGTVQLADGRVAFYFDAARVDRVAWKIVRGLHCLQTGIFIPEDYRPRLIEIIGPDDAGDKLRSHPWFPHVMQSGSLPFSDVGAAFDVKVMCAFGRPTRLHFYALLFWDRIFILVTFHDPICRCQDCLVGAK